MLRLYDFQCPKCGHIKEYIIEDNEKVSCPNDGSELKRLPHVFRINMGPVPLTGYYDDNLQTYITSNTHRKKVMEKQGLSENGATPKPQGQAWV